MVRFFKKYWFLLLVLLFTLAARLYRIEELFYFTYDESIPAFVGRRLALLGHVPLIGGVTPFNFHLGPYFYWLLSGIIWLGNFNPVSWGYAGALFSLVTVSLIFIVAYEFSSKKTAVLASSFWAFSFLANIYDRHFWALYWGPILSLIFIFSLYKIIKGNEKFVYLISIASVWAIHTDPSNLTFLVLTVLVWIIYRLPVTKNTILAIAIVVLSFLPLVAFDLRHNFSNLAPFINYLKSDQSKPTLTSSNHVNNTLLFPQTATRLAFTFSDPEISKQYSYCEVYSEGKLAVVPKLLVILSSVVLLAFVVWTFRGNKNEKIGWKLLSLLILTYFAGIQLYGTIFNADIFEHYITGLFPAFILILAKIISSFPKKAWIVILGIFIGFNLYKLSVTQSNQGLKNKNMAVNYAIFQTRGEPFSIESISTCWRYGGFRYLFSASGIEPVKSYVDPNLGHLYGTTTIQKNHPGTVVAFVTHDFVPEREDFYKNYALLKSHETESSIFGNIEVIIMDNSTDWFGK